MLAVTVVREKQILRAAYPTAWGPKLAALRMTRAGVGLCFPKSQRRDMGYPAEPLG